VGRALTFSSEGGQLVPTLDGSVLHEAIAEELSPIEVEGRDATFRIKNGTPRVVKSKVGTGVSDDELAAAVEGVLDLPAVERRVTVSVGTREPSLTTEQAKALGVKERLSTFTQNFPYAAYRVQNIGQAAERVNGTLLLPGETFSMNDTIKERTEENGYTEGFVVGEGGVFAEALGGGVSAAATTTWTAAFFAGMERVQTIAHSIYISRYQPGLEATVAWGIFDMKFRNDTSNAVFITAGITNTSMTVSFWGTKEYDEITAEFGERTSIVPFQKIYDKSEDCLGQDGVEGFTITVDRVFYKGGEEVRREPITTRYKPAPDVTCGPKPDKKPGTKPGKGDQAAGATGDAAADPSATPSADPAEPPPGDDVFTNE
jgi:vancomycin resistance protein YoaR